MYALPTLLLALLLNVSHARESLPALPVQGLHFTRTSHLASLRQRRESREEDDRFFRFVTRPDIVVPRWNIVVYEKAALAPGYWFVAPYAELDQRDAGSAWNGPLIYDASGTLIWSGAPQFHHFNTFDFRTVSVGDSQMLSLIYPHDRHREGLLLNREYNVHRAVDLRGQLEEMNMHDFTLVDNAERALTLSNMHGESTVEQSRSIGFDGNCIAGWEGFKELRLNDSEILFEWSAKEWLRLDESTFTPGTVEERCHHGWDILHLNSIDKSPDGDYVLSSRHMDAIYKVSRVDGRIIWRLGGTKSDFHFDDPAAKFSRQHHARVRSQNETHLTLSLFDNAVGSGPGEDDRRTNDVSRGLLLSLRTTPPMTARLLAHYDHPQSEIVNSRGSMQLLPNGNYFMSWTYSSRQSEHSPDGKLLMEAYLQEGTAHSYRNYKSPWIGRPNLPPSVYSTAIDANNGTVSTVVYVSWNGATEIVSWNLYKVSADGLAQELVAKTPKQGFETGMAFAGYAAFVLVEALDKDGTPLEFGRSEVVKTVEPMNMQSPDAIAEMFWLEKVESDQSPYWCSGAVDKSAAHFVFAFMGGAIVLVIVRYVLRSVWKPMNSAATWWKGRGLLTYKLIPQRHARM